LSPNTDFNLASIPAGFSETSDEPSDQKYMIALFDRGYNPASQNYFWIKAPARLELATQAATEHWRPQQPYSAASRT
jgi:hypothetical protein